MPTSAFTVQAAECEAFRVAGTVVSFPQNTVDYTESTHSSHVSKGSCVQYALPVPFANGKCKIEEEPCA